MSGDESLCWPRLCPGSTGRGMRSGDGSGETSTMPGFVAMRLVLLWVENEARAKQEVSAGASRLEVHRGGGGEGQ